MMKIYSMNQAICGKVEAHICQNTLNLCVMRSRPQFYDCISIDRASIESRNAQICPNCVRLLLFVFVEQKSDESANWLETQETNTEKKALSRCK